MKILALEFSSGHRGAAVFQDPAAGTPALALSETLDEGPRNTRAFGLIQTVLREAGLEPGQIDCLAVGLGPGSYTGIRVSIALAQGWQLGRGVKLLGLSSVECLAADAQAAGLRGRVNLAIDAQRREFYLAAYDLAPDSVRPLDPLHLASFDEVQAKTQAGQLLAGPGLAQWFAAQPCRLSRAEEPVAEITKPGPCVVEFRLETERLIESTGIGDD